MDESNGLVRVAPENGLDLDLLTDLVADFIRNSFKNVFHLLLFLVNVARDGPDQFQTVKERAEGITNGFKLTLGDVLELAF